MHKIFIFPSTITKPFKVYSDYELLLFIPLHTLMEVWFSVG